MSIINALVGRTSAYRNLLAEWTKTLDEQLRQETKLGFDLLDHQREFTNEITMLREQLKEYVPKDVHLQVVETAERLRFLNETGETLIRTLQQRIYDLEHTIPVEDTTKFAFPVPADTHPAWWPEDENPPKKPLKKKATKKAPAFVIAGGKVRRVVAKKAKKPLSILRGKRTKK